MRTLVISDVHANLDAFKAVLEDAVSFDRVFLLGDLVGYGPDPNECIELAASLPGLHCVLGNHDAALLGFITPGNFNHEAQKALEVQQELLKREQLEWLELLPVEDLLPGIRLVHGSPRNPIWEYLLSGVTAFVNFEAFSEAVCLIGHTHIPSIFSLDGGRSVKVLQPSSGDLWRSNGRFLLNPGSVGQPRDANPKASYVIFDDEEATWQFRRVAYDYRPVQERIHALGIPARHADRLAKGL